LSEFEAVVLFFIIIIVIIVIIIVVVFVAIAIVTVINIKIIFSALIKLENICRNFQINIISAKIWP